MASRTNEPRRFAPTEGFLSFDEFIRHHCLAIHGYQPPKASGWTAAKDEQLGNVSYGYINSEGTAGCLMLWAQSAEKLLWFAEDRRGMRQAEGYYVSAADFEARDAHRAEAERMEREKKELAAQVALKAQAVWDKLVPASPDNAYLVKKGISAAARWFRQSPKSGQLCLPFIAGGRIVNLQRIFLNEYGKWMKLPFMRGGQCQGAYYQFGEGNPKVIAEGAATAASLWLSLGEPAVCAFNCGNLPVAAGSFKDSLRFIAADNDWQHNRNAGLLEAEKTHRLYPAMRIVCAPRSIAGKDTEGADWNDVFRIEGAEAVQRAFEREKKESEAQPVKKARDARAETLARLAMSGIEKKEENKQNDKLENKKAEKLGAASAAGGAIRAEADADRMANIEISRHSDDISGETGISASPSNCFNSAIPVEFLRNYKEALQQMAKDGYWLSEIPVNHMAEA